MPAAAISVKSWAIRADEGNWLPSASGAKVPYATPFTRKRRVPTARNLPSTRGAILSTARSDPEVITVVKLGVASIESKPAYDSENADSHTTCEARDETFRHVSRDV